MKTVIVYATRTGTTKKAVEMIAEKLKDKPDIVNLGEIKKVDLPAYDFVLLGGPIKMGKLHNATKKFLAQNRKTLLAKRFGFFLACGYPQELENYFKVILDSELAAHAEVKTDIGYAYYLENMGPIEQRVVIQLAKTDKSIEAYKTEAIQKIADVINGK